METGSWTLGCEHCGGSLADDSKYQSPACPTCGFHVHQECLAVCAEGAAPDPDTDDSGWHFACGHCAEPVPPQGPGWQSPTCASCHFHVHASCFGRCPEEPTFTPFTTDYKIVPSTKDINTRERRQLETLYPTDMSRNNHQYLSLVRALGCVFLNDVSYLRLSCGDELAWLNPYTGNQHNRCVFVQLVLAALWRDSASRRFSGRLFEAFLGSGQVFMNFSWCAGLLGNKQPRVIAGDLNVCLCCAWMGITGQLGATRAFVVGYLNKAVRLDHHLGGLGGSDQNTAFYASIRARLNALLKPIFDAKAPLEDCALEVCTEIAYLYIYLNNRCANQTSYNLSTGNFSASLDKAKIARLDAIRTSEWNALCRACKIAVTTELRFSQADFAVTTQSAGLGDLVIYDCPFPEFRIAIPGNLQSDVDLIVNRGWFDVDVTEALQQCRKQGDMKGGGHYVGDEGGNLQLRILEDAVARVRGGATVVICNYATPTLLVWYSKLSMALYFEPLPIFLFKRPQTGDELYCLAMWPSDHVLALTEMRAGAYVKKRIQAVYGLISDAMSNKSCLSSLTVKAILDQHWK